MDLGEYIVFSLELFSLEWWVPGSHTGGIWKSLWRSEPRRWRCGCSPRRRQKDSPPQKSKISKEVPTVKRPTWNYRTEKYRFKKPPMRRSGVEWRWQKQEYVSSGQNIRIHPLRKMDQKKKIRTEPQGPAWKSKLNPFKHLRKKLYEFYTIAFINCFYNSFYEASIILIPTQNKNVMKIQNYPLKFLMSIDVKTTQQVKYNNVLKELYTTTSWELFQEHRLV